VKEAKKKLHHVVSQFTLKKIEASGDPLRDLDIGALDDVFEMAAKHVAALETEEKPDAVVAATLAADLDNAEALIEKFMSSQDSDDYGQSLEAVGSVFRRWQDDGMRSQLGRAQLDRLALFAVRHGAVLAEAQLHRLAPASP
jgi:hypothetical protein